ncbi:MAG TPA: bacillithiol biosynthesis deacetylase BshB1 [Candidatus Koribacter sp.]|jgi:bacillithiol biosynthesis deacetylase BshB1
MANTEHQLDILALAAHRDDIEQTCGGTLLKAAQSGQRTGVLDLTQGEMGTRGDVASRARESEAAAKILGVSWRAALDLPDGRVENTFANRLKVARVLREQRPRVLILPYWQGRHPDHYTASTLGYEATFLAGLTKLGSTPATADIPASEELLKLMPHRPFKIVYASLYYDVRPSFVVDITAQFDAKVRSLLAYESQYSDQAAGTGLFPAHQEIRQRLETMARFYGLLAGVDYAEPYVQKEIGLVEALTLVPVKSM